MQKVRGVEAMIDRRTPVSFARRLWSRRQVLASAGIAAIFSPVLARAQAPAADPGQVIMLRAQSANANLRGPAATATPVWAFTNGDIPGTVLRPNRGTELRVRLQNDLPEPTSIHWHGIRVPNSMDGVPGLTQAPVGAGASFDYRFGLPDAGTYWLHPTGLHAAQAGRGLRGVLIVGEPEPVGIDRDLLMLLEDWSLASDGTLSGAPDASTHITINAQPSIGMPVRTNERLRLRLVNATSARAISLRIEGHEPVVVAIDGQPSEPFPARDSRVVLGPGNRIDLFIDALLSPGSRAAITAQIGPSEISIAQLVYEPVPARAAPLGPLKALPANPLPERLDLRSAARPRFVVGLSASPVPPVHERKPLFSVRRGRVVVLACQNRSDKVQSIHWHGHHARLLDRLDDGWKPFWLDTLMVAPRQTERVAFLADNPGKWLIEARPVGAVSEATEAWFEVT
jgi:FtsP/CotA-like multicopper oxidase with cupredoxin domain